MTASFKLSLNELNTDFIEKIKSMFDSKKIVEIHISEETDETEYLLSTSANRESLFRSLQQLDDNEVVIKHKSEITEENLAVKRPGNGISPMRWDEIVGEKAKRDFQKDDLILL